MLRPLIIEHARLLASVIALSPLALPNPVDAKTYTQLYAFKGGNGDGGNPQYPLVMHKNNLFGTTDFGGADNFGTIFELTPRGKETVLHSFTGGRDGGVPAGIVVDGSGSIYGVANIGGTGRCVSSAGAGCGTVFKLDADGTLTVPYAFQGGTDGAYPNAGVLLDRNGNLYGTTDVGGGGNCLLSGLPPGCGTVFKLAPDGAETVLYAFKGGSADGTDPNGSVVFDTSGNLYGTTTFGGGTGCDRLGCGTVFRLAPDGIETVLYSFCAVSGCTDGAEPFTVAPLLDARGHIRGTTQFGGSGSGCSSAIHCGTVFELAPSGKETVLYSFCLKSKCRDGYLPSTGVIADGQGNLYATAVLGGSHNDGLVFQLTPRGRENALHVFAGRRGGSEPEAALIGDKSGNLYGTTFYGGGSQACGGLGCGTVFEVKE